MILVVEDHEDTRYLLLKLLKRLGYEAVDAAGGQEAIDCLQDVIPELIILDCNMPCVSGLDVLRAVRADPRLVDVPVVVFSADAEVTARPEFDMLGVRDWIVKGSMDWERIAHVARLYAGPGNKG